MHETTVFLHFIAALIAEARKGNPIGRFWDQLAYTRIVTWYRRQIYPSKN